MNVDDASCVLTDRLCSVPQTEAVVQGSGVCPSAMITTQQQTTANIDRTTLSIRNTLESSTTEGDRYACFVFVVVV